MKDKISYLINKYSAAQMSEDSLNSQNFAEGGVRLKGCHKKGSADKPLVTIITAVFNSEKYVEDTIQSVINQTSMV